MNTAYPWDVFKQEFLAEWSRLNPKFRRPGDGIFETFKNAFREGIYGYFSPLWILLWSLRFVAKRLVQALQA